MTLHLPFVIALLLGVLGVALGDMTETVQTLAVTQDRSHLAGLMAALGALAGILVAVSAVGALLLYGVSWRAVAVVAVVVATSYVSTVWSTKQAGKTIRRVARAVLKRR